MVKCGITSCPKKGIKPLTIKGNDGERYVLLYYCKKHDGTRTFKHNFARSIQKTKIKKPRKVCPRCDMNLVTPPNNVCYTCHYELLDIPKT